MKNKIQAGKVLSVLAPYAVLSGQALQVGALVGVASNDAANGASVEIDREGVYSLAAVTADTGTIGAKAYWDNTAKRITTTATNNTLVGCFMAAKANGDTSATVLLDGVIR
jgi:predicted RecA/RadA family phage recombinase